MNGARRWTLRASLVLLGVLLAGLALEVALSWMGVVPLEQSPLRGYHRSHPLLGWVGNPDHTARFRGAEFDLVISNGPDGFRRSEVAFQGPESAPRVVFLGDSFTWGWGVEQGEVFTDCLQRALQGQWRIENRGVNAWGTAQQRLLLDEILSADPPARVVVMFFGNDPVECVDDRGGKRPVFALEEGRLVRHNVPVRRRLTSPLRELSKRSIVLTCARSMINNLTLRLRDGEVSWLDHVDSGEAPRGWEVCRALLLDLRAACAAAGVEFQLVFIPVAFEVTESDPAVKSILRGLVEKLCREEHVAWLDLTLGLRAAWSQGEDRAPGGWPYYYPQDQHWTRPGHALAARLIAAWWDG